MTGPPLTGPPPNRFLDACGLTGVLRLDVEDPAGSATGTWEFDRPFVVIGRASDADLVLDHPDVSRRHAYLQVVAGRLFCVDCGSRAGTHWESGPGFAGWVDPEHGVRVGPFRVRPGAGFPERQPVTDEDPLPTSRSFGQPPEVEGVPNLLESTRGLKPWRIIRALVLVGRFQRCKVRLETPEVSRIHCSLVRTPTDLWAVDLLSREGIVVNAQRVRWTRLGVDDELRVGDQVFRLRDAARRGSSTTLPVWRGGDAAVPASAYWQGPEGLQALDGRPELVESLVVPLLNEIGQMHQMQRQMAEQFHQAMLTMIKVVNDMHQEQMSLVHEELARIRELTDEQRQLQAQLSQRFGLDGLPPPAADTPEPSAAVRPEQVEAKKIPRQPRPAAAQAAEELHAVLVSRLAVIQEERQGRWQKLLGAVMGKATGDASP